MYCVVVNFVLNRLIGVRRFHIICFVMSWLSSKFCDFFNYIISLFTQFDTHASKATHLFTHLDLFFLGLNPLFTYFDTWLLAILSLLTYFDLWFYAFASMFIRADLRLLTAQSTLHTLYTTYPIFFILIILFFLLCVLLAYLYRSNVTVKLNNSSTSSSVGIQSRSIFTVLRLNVVFILSRLNRFIIDWVLTTNHKRLAILYFMFIFCSGLVGLTLATIMRLEFAYPGQFFIVKNAERYLTIASLHGIIMVFFVVIPLIFGAFANFLLPLQLGVRDVAFPRLNSFMFWLTPSGLVLLMHTLFFDRSHTTISLVSYSEQRALLRRRFSSVESEITRFHENAQPSTLAWRLASFGQNENEVKSNLLRQVVPTLTTNTIGLDGFQDDRRVGFSFKFGTYQGNSQLTNIRLLISYLVQSLRIKFWSYEALFLSTTSVTPNTYNEFNSYYASNLVSIPDKLFSYSISVKSNWHIGKMANTGLSAALAPLSLDYHLTTNYLLTRNNAGLVFNFIFSKLSFLDYVLLFLLDESVGSIQHHVWQLTGFGGRLTYLDLLLVGYVCGMYESLCAVDHLLLLGIYYALYPFSYLDSIPAVLIDYLLYVDAATMRLISSLHYVDLLFFRLASPASTLAYFVDLDLVFWLNFFEYLDALLVNSFIFQGFSRLDFYFFKVFSVLRAVYDFLCLFIFEYNFLILRITNGTNGTNYPVFTRTYAQVLDFFFFLDSWFYAILFSYRGLSDVLSLIFTTYVYSIYSLLLIHDLLLELDSILMYALFNYNLDFLFLNFYNYVLDLFSILDSWLYAILFSYRGLSDILGLIFTTYVYLIYFMLVVYDLFVDLDSVFVYVFFSNPDSLFLGLYSRVFDFFFVLDGWFYALLFSCRGLSDTLGLIFTTYSYLTYFMLVVHDLFVDLDSVFAYIFFGSNLGSLSTNLYSTVLDFFFFLDSWLYALLFSCRGLSDALSFIFTTYVYLIYSLLVVHDLFVELDSIFVYVFFICNPDFLFLNFYNCVLDFFFVLDGWLYSLLFSCRGLSDVTSFIFTTYVYLIYSLLVIHDLFVDLDLVFAYIFFGSNLSSSFLGLSSYGYLPSIIIVNPSITSPVNSQPLFGGSGRLSGYTDLSVEKLCKTTSFVPSSSNLGQFVATQSYRYLLDTVRVLEYCSGSLFLSYVRLYYTLSLLYLDCLDTVLWIQSYFIPLDAIFLTEGLVGICARSFNSLLSLYKLFAFFDLGLLWLYRWLCDQLFWFVVDPVKTLTRLYPYVIEFSYVLTYVHSYYISLFDNVLFTNFEFSLKLILFLIPNYSVPYLSSCLVSLDRFIFLLFSPIYFFFTWFDYLFIGLFTYLGYLDYLAVLLVSPIYRISNTVDSLFVNVSIYLDSLNYLLLNPVYSILLFFDKTFNNIFSIFVLFDRSLYYLLTLLNLIDFVYYHAITFFANYSIFFHIDSFMHFLFFNSLTPQSPQFALVRNYSFGLTVPISSLVDEAACTEFCQRISEDRYQKWCQLSLLQCFTSVSLPLDDTEGYLDYSKTLDAKSTGTGLSFDCIKPLLSDYSQNSFLDYFFDWRELKLEREVWRSTDLLGYSRLNNLSRSNYYSSFFEPAAVASHSSAWSPNKLIPGWAFVTPYTSRLKYTTLGKVDVALMVVLIAAVGSVFSSINYLITYRYMGAPLLQKRRELRSFFVDALLVASRMMVLANPALILGIILLLSDRHLGTSVFDFSGGGDTILFQHLFWFFGHPEVYIIIIPCFGIMNSLLPAYLRKRLSGRLSLQFSVYTIALMGFVVWGHHMYMVGLANSVRTLYSTMTVMISVPASTKVLHWCVTLIQANWVADVGFLFLLDFLYFFVLGGLSGMFVAHIGFDVIFHDTFYVIGHFHVMLAGAALSACFSAFYYYFSAIFGVRYSRFYAYLHYAFYTAGQILTLAPMFWLGYSGMPRRVLDYPTTLVGWHSLATSGHFLTVTSVFFLILMLFDSFYEGRVSTSRVQGVSRLNNRLAFFGYECRKLRLNQSRSLPLRKGTNRFSSSELFSFCYQSEQLAWEYTFTKPKLGK